MLVLCRDKRERRKKVHLGANITQSKQNIAVAVKRELNTAIKVILEDRK